MLPRLLETEVMDTADEAREYDAMDHAAVNDRFVADLLEARGTVRGGRILDVGAGTALIPITLAKADPTARVLGVDLADHMLELARRNVDRAGLGDRITLERVDAKGLPFDDGGFDAVLSNTIVHHIPEPASAMAEMVRMVAPGGVLFVRDLARPDSLEALEQLVETYAGGESPRARGLFQDSLHAALTLSEVRAILHDLGLPTEGVRMTSDRHWTWTWQRPQT